MKSTALAWRRSAGLTLLLFVSGLVSLLLAPPTQIPDEPAHFFRAYQVSSGRILGERQGGGAGGYLPSVLAPDIAVFEDQCSHPEIKISRSTLLQRIETSHYPSSENLQFTGFPNSVLYSPVPYLPQAIGITVGKVLGLRSMVIFYLARFANLLAGSLILFFAFRAIEFSERRTWVLFLIGATPMMMHEFASVSADPFTIAIACFVAAIAQRLNWKWDAQSFTAYLIASALLSLTKSVYLLLPLWIVPAILSGPRDLRLRRLAWVVGCAVLPAVIWALMARSLYVPARPGVAVNPGLQAHFFLAHPFSVLWTFIKSLRSNIRGYRDGMIGLLGLLDVPVSKYILKFHAIVLILIALVAGRDEERYPFGKPLRLAFEAVIGLGTLFLICMSVYMSWTEVGGATLEGLQGRYLLPILPFALMALPVALPLSPVRYQAVKALSLLWWGFLTFSTGAVLAARFWG